jgi:predicted lysophospholipase L1 biosynthesis ABC-type transport system permease subunit
MEEAWMPLSEHDRQVLAQMEQDLCAEDAKLVKTLRSTSANSYALRRLRRSAFMFTVGLATLVFAVMMGSAIASIFLGMSAFVVMLLAALRGSAVLRRLREAQRNSRRLRSRKSAAPTFRSMAERAQQRWQHRPDR